MMAMRKVFAADIVLETPPMPFRSWTPAAVEKRLKKEGFDFSRPMDRVEDLIMGVYWEQEEK